MSDPSATGSREDDLRLIREGLDAFNRGEIAVVLALLDDDVEIYSTPELVDPGTYEGHAGFLRWAEQWLEAWDGFRIERFRLQPIGRRHVVAAVHTSARGRGSGIPVEMDVAYMWDVRDGKAVAMHLYASGEEAVAVAERRERKERD